MIATTTASIFYALFIIVFTSDGPAAIDKMYGTKFDCEVSEGAMLSKARDTKEVIGWSIPAECVPVVENNKV